MTQFDGKEEKTLIANKKSVNTANAVFIIILFISSLLCAATSVATGDGFTLLYPLIFFAIALLGFIAFHIFIFPKHTKSLNDMVAKKIIAAFDEAKIFDGERVELTVDFDNDTFMVARKGYLKEIVINPAQGNKKAQYGSVGFDLTELKKLPAVYSAFGTRVLEYLQAYFQLHCDCDCATVYDRTGKETEEIYLVADGKTVSDTKKNYFLKTGLIK